jgi:hypothetical protein
MSSPTARPAGVVARPHPAVLRWRIAEWLTAGLIGVLVLAATLAIAMRVADPNWLLCLAVGVGALGLLFLLFSPRLEVSVMLLAFYLGCIDGPVKLFSGGGNGVAVIRDVLIYSVAIGALVRLCVRREPVRLPRLLPWVAAFVALVLVEALNPNTHGALKILGGYRQQLEWVPFFFFGYAVMRSKDRMRKMFVVLGLIAVANGVVAAYQSRLSPQQFAAWGPGYAERVLGTDGTSGTTYSSEGEGHVRPLGLGSDIGFAGAVGLIALPCTLALLATTKGRRRWLVPLLSLGALLAVLSSQSRTSILGAVAALLAFGFLSLTAGRQVLKPLLALLVLLVLGAGTVAVLASTEGSSAFARYASIEPENVGSSAPSYKEVSLKQIPNDVAHDPFGFGLGTAGSAAGFGGKTTVQLEGHGFSSETELNFIMNETGLPGLIWWICFFPMLLILPLRYLRRVADVDMRIDLAAAFSVLYGFALIQFAGAFTTGEAPGPYFWFVAGVASFWLLGPGRARTRAAAPATAAAGSTTPALA